MAAVPMIVNLHAPGEGLARKAVFVKLRLGVRSQRIGVAVSAGGKNPASTALNKVGKNFGKPIENPNPTAGS